MWQLLLIASVIIVSINALCSWNRAIPPENADNAATMNFINGEWERDYEKSADGLLNGQPYWKKTQYDNCYVQTLYLYYYQGTDDGDLEWLVSPNWGSTPSSAYVRCSMDKPQPANPTKCNDAGWLFAPDGNPTASSGDYIPDEDFYFKSGECPQLLCESVEFFTDGNDFYDGEYQRVSTNDQNNRNVYKQSGNSDSSTNEFYLYFNENMFVWVINEEYETDCQKTTDGQLTSVSTVLKWSEASAISDASFFYYETGSTATRFITCSGQIPTTSPSKSDATGRPSPAPTVDDSICDTFPSSPACQPTSPTTPGASPTSPTVSWPTVPTTADALPSGSNMFASGLLFYVCLFVTYYLLR